MFEKLNKGRVLDVFKGLHGGEFKDNGKYLEIKVAETKDSITNKKVTSTTITPDIQVPLKLNRYAGLFHNRTFMLVTNPAIYNRVNILEQEDIEALEDLSIKVKVCNVKVGDWMYRIYCLV